MTSLPNLLNLSSEQKVMLFDDIITLISLRVKDSKSSLETTKIKTVKPPTSSGKKEYVTSVNPEDERCYETLRKWRNQVAKDLGIQAYMILDNKTLMSIAHYKPRNEDELLMIKGLGQEKVGRYSGTILEIVERTSTYQRKLEPPKEKRRLGPNKLMYVSDGE
jgi:superfamily II DNA helicase RecQ